MTVVLPDEGRLADVEALLPGAGIALLTAPGVSVPIVLDRPFLFLVHDTEHGTPLFLDRAVPRPGGRPVGVSHGGGPP